METVKCNKQDLDWAFGVQGWSIIITGIWTNEIQNHYCSILHRVQLPILIFLIIVFWMLPEFYAFYQVRHQFNLIIENILITSFAVCSTAKMFLLWRKRKVYHPLIDTLITNWMTSKESWERDIMIKHARWPRFFTIIGLFLSMFTYLGFIFGPLIGLPVRTINNITDISKDRVLPIQVYYPYDITASPIFELTYISLAFIGFFLSLGFTIPENFYGTLVFHLSGQFEILQTKVKHMFPAQENEMVKLTKLDRQCFQHKLYKLVYIHKKLIRDADSIEKAFNLLVLIQITVASMTICCLGFQTVSLIRNASEQNKMIQSAITGAALSGFFFHLFIFCTSGENLTECSSELSYAVYCSSWYLVQSKYARGTLPILIRTNIPIHLTAGNFFYLSNSSFLKIVKSSFGYISMLLAVTK